MPPTDSVARVRKQDDMPRTGCGIDTEANIKYADAHEGARPPEQICDGVDADQNCAGTDADVETHIETPARTSALRRPLCCRSDYLSR